MLCLYMCIYKGPEVTLCYFFVYESIWEQEVIQCHIWGPEVTQYYIYMHVSIGVGGNLISFLYVSIWGPEVSQCYIYMHVSIGDQR
jgi:hypothetical protein